MDFQTVSVRCQIRSTTLATACVFGFLVKKYIIRGYVLNIEDFEGQFQRNDKIAVRQIAGETMLIPINQTGVDLQKVYLLNEPAAAAWELLEQPLSINDLVNSLLQEFDAEPSLIQKDIEELLQDFSGLGFVTQIEGRS